MVDNTELNSGTGGDTIATDDIGGVKHQRVKIQHGADGSATDVSSASPLPVDGSGVTQPVSAAALPLPSGAATSANQLADGHNVANAGTFAVQADSVIPGVGATNLGKAEDAVHASGDVGIMPLGVRTDVPASTVADGDYAPFLMSEEGALWTENLPSEVEAGNSSTSTLGIGATFTGTGVDLLDHQAITVMIDASHDSAVDGMQFQFSSDNSNWDISLDFTYTVNGGRIFQFGIYAQYFRIVYTNGGTGQTHFRCQTLLHHETTLTTIHRLVDDTSPDRSAEIVKSVVIAQAAGTGDFVPVQATSSGNFKISVQEISDGLDIGAGNAGAETQRVSISTDDVNLAAINAGQLADGHGVAAAGDIAHDAADSGNPVKVGGVAETTEQTAVADGDRANLMTDLNGKLVTQPYSVPERSTDGLTAAITGTSNTSVIAAPGAGLRIYITQIIVTNSHATVGTLVELKSATTVKVRGYAREDGGGYTIHYPKPLRLGVNEAFNAANVTTGSNTYVSASGYIAP